MERLFLSYSIEKLRQSEGRIQHCLELLSQDQVWWRGSEESNSIANLSFAPVRKRPAVDHIVHRWPAGSKTAGRRVCRTGRREHSGASSEIARNNRRSNASDRARNSSASQRDSPHYRAMTKRSSKRSTTSWSISRFTRDKISMPPSYCVNEDLGFYKHLNNPAHNEKTP